MTFFDIFFLSNPGLSFLFFLYMYEFYVIYYYLEYLYFMGE